MGFRFLLFIVVPLLELWLLLKLSALIGALAVLVIVAATTLIGIRVLQIAGWHTWVGSRWRLQRGESPAPELADGFLLALGGLLLVLPGLISDFVGLLFLIRPLRKYCAGRFTRSRAAGMGPDCPGGPITIEGEYRRGS